jgi:hypothetical protein
MDKGRLPVMLLQAGMGDRFTTFQNINMEFIYLFEKKISINMS